MRQVEGSVQWWIGDWLNFGKRKWGEKYKEAVAETGLSYQYLANLKDISNKIQFSRRRPNLTWAHHQEVAPLEPEEQEYWLNKAEDESLTRNQLRSQIRESKVKEPPLLPEGKYNVIYADPPWQLDQCFKNRRFTSEHQCRLRTIMSTFYFCNFFIYKTLTFLK